MHNLELRVNLIRDVQNVLKAAAVELRFIHLEIINVSIQGWALGLLEKVASFIAKYIPHIYTHPHCGSMYV